MSNLIHVYQHTQVYLKYCLFFSAHIILLLPSSSLLLLPSPSLPLFLLPLFSSPSSPFLLLPLPFPFLLPSPPPPPPQASDDLFMKLQERNISVVSKIILPTNLSLNPDLELFVSIQDNYIYCHRLG